MTVNDVMSMRTLWVLLLVLSMLIPATVLETFSRQQDEEDTDRSSGSALPPLGALTFELGDG